MAHGVTQESCGVSPPRACELSGTFPRCEKIMAMATVTKDDLKNGCGAALSPQSRDLASRLLALAGERVFVQEPDPEEKILLARGRLFSEPVRLRLGEEHACHRNAAELWGRAVA